MIITAAEANKLVISIASDKLNKKLLDIEKQILDTCSRGLNTTIVHFDGTHHMLEAYLKDKGYDIQCKQNSGKMQVSW